MKGAPIRGPRFSGVDDNLSGFSDSGLGDSSSNQNQTPAVRRDSNPRRSKEPQRKSVPTNNQTQKVSSNKNGRTSLDNRQQKKGTDKKRRTSVSTSRSNDDSKEKDQSDTTQDINDKPYQQMNNNEQQTIDNRKEKETKVKPTQGFGYLSNGFSLRKLNFQSLVKSHIQRIKRDNEQRGFSDEVTKITPECLNTLLSASEMHIFQVDIVTELHQ